MTAKHMMTRHLMTQHLMNTHVMTRLAALGALAPVAALLLLSGCCHSEPRPLSPALANGRVYRVIDGFPRENTPQQVELALLYKLADADSGTTRALVGREGFIDSAGVVTESRDPASYMIHHSTPMLRLASGWSLISGQQSILETDKTTIHSWGTKFIVWVRPAAAGRDRQDLVFALNNPVCVTIGVDLNIRRGDPCTSGTRVPTRQYVIVNYPASGAPTTTAPQPTASITDQTILDFLRFARLRSTEMGLGPFP